MLEQVSVVHSFLFQSSILFVWMDHHLFIHMPTDGYLGYVHSLVIADKVSVNICI